MFCGGLWAREGSSSFLQKRTKKLLSIGFRVAATRTQMSKSFLVLFCKKELLAFLF
jgi:hypothetical protein